MNSPSMRFGPVDKKRAALLLVKRSFAFIIDLTLVIFFLILIEILVAVVLSILEINTIPDTPIKNSFSNINFICIPIIIGIIESGILKFNSIGIKIAKLKIISSYNIIMALFGCLFRNLLIFLIPQLFIYLFLFKKFFLNPGMETLFYDVAILLFLIIIWPVSIYY